MKALTAVLVIGLLAGCFGPSKGQMVFEDGTTICRIADYHYSGGFGNNYATVSCVDKASGQEVCKYQMGVDKDGHSNGSYYNCRYQKPAGAT